MKEFVISDTHWGHKNIISYCHRPFKTAEEMDLELIKRWNSVVSVDDRVYHVGDFAFHKRDDDLQVILMKLNGYKYLIRGNHDKLTDSKYKKLGFFDVCKSLYLERDGKRVVFEHIPSQDTARSGYSVYIHGHTHDIDPDFSHKCMFNACVERINYTPALLSDIIRQVSERDK